MEEGIIYFNGGNRPCVKTPDIAKSYKDARRWLVAALLIRDINARSIRCTRISNYRGYSVLAVKTYRRSFDNNLFHYPESESGRLTQKYQRQEVR